MVEAFFGHGETDQSAAELGHEVNGFGRDLFRRDGEVAFVLAVFVVDHDDHASGADLLNRGGDVGEWRLGAHIEAILAEAVIVRDGLQRYELNHRGLRVTQGKVIEKSHELAAENSPKLPFRRNDRGFATCSFWEKLA